MRLFGFDHAVTAGQDIEPMFRALSYHPANMLTRPPASGECAAIVEHLDFRDARHPANDASGRIMGTPGPMGLAILKPGISARQDRLRMQNKSNPEPLPTRPRTRQHYGQSPSRQGLQGAA
jgi:hypothetical protein